MRSTYATRARLSDDARDVLEAVRQGILTSEQARRYFGLPLPPVPSANARRPMAQAFPQLVERSLDSRDSHPAISYLTRLCFGICWRTLLVGTAILMAQSGYAPPLPAVGVLLLLGSVAGLWRRPGPLGQVWRWVALSAAVAWVGPHWSSEYAHLVALALILATVASWRSNGRPR